jgi:hypothetical protein
MYKNFVILEWKNTNVAYIEILGTDCFENNDNNSNKESLFMENCCTRI